MKTYKNYKTISNIWKSIPEGYVRQVYNHLFFAVNQSYTPSVITGQQIRAARALIGWKQTDLADASGVSTISIKKIESGVTDPRASTLEAIQSAFNKAGVVFLEPGDTRDGGPGLRLKR